MTGEGGGLGKVWVGRVCAGLGPPPLMMRDGLAVVLLVLGVPFREGA